MSRKKLVFLINSLAKGGAEKVLCRIANYFAEKGYDVEVIFLEKNEFYKLNKKIKKTFLSKLSGNEPGIIKFLSIPILALKLKKYLKNNNIDLVQSHIYRANYVNILSKLLGSNHNAQIVVPGAVSFYINEGLLGKLNLALIKYLFPKANLIVWKSKEMKLDANRLFNFKTKQIVISNPYDFERITTLSNDKVLDFEFKKNKKYIISVGRLVRLKRYDVLLKALNKLEDNIELILLGEGEEEKELKTIAKNLGISYRVHFLGYKDNPYKYMSKCHLFVHTSETEGFPNVIIEALACKLPVISSDCISGPREILAPNTNIRKKLDFNDDIEIAKYGILYPVGNVELLTKAIRKLLNDMNLYKKYKKLSVERIKEYSIENIMKKYENILISQN